MMKRLLFAALLLSLLSACGNKAALMLPEKPTATPASAPAPAKDTPAPHDQP
ncbi:MAG: hypothetical protein KUL77_03450 [Thermomonas sp.]|jgi:predicted small lipoprotein YifL|uniref:LPS translocon maturation chaperone LptM n=1 Tax=Thermomonas sp. TaxID=1971895 RepID=UPI001EC9F0D8|nr:hypothetical protein [Thermomonas sp.]MBV2208605.1 hypothetical protein [Thermomonas sp.]